MFERRILEKLDKNTSEAIYLIKAISIIFVCYTHSYIEPIYFVGGIPVWFDFIQYSLSVVIARTAVPLFFFVSAFLLYTKEYSYKDNLKKKFKTLFIPYIIFNLISFFVFYTLEPRFTIENWKISDWVNAFVGYRNAYPILFTLWFLRNLMLLNLFCDFIKFIIKKFNIKFVFLLGILYLYISYFTNCRNIISGVSSIFYWSAGAYFALNHIDLFKIKTYAAKYKLQFIYIVGMILLFILHCYKIKYNFALGNFETLIGCLCIISFAFSFKDCNLKQYLLKISKYTFCIYLLHGFNLNFFSKLLYAMLNTQILYISLGYIFCPILNIIYCIILSVLIKRLSPKVYAVLFGNR